MPVESEDLYQGERHVDGDEEEVGDAEDQDEDILGCQHHLGVHWIDQLYFYVVRSIFSVNLSKYVAQKDD